MNNFSQYDELLGDDFDVDKPLDIEFDDVDVAKLQENIKEAMDDNPVFAVKEENLQIMREAMPEITPNSKKYIIYIEPENVEFIENLSLKDRKAIVNDILKEQNIVYAQKKAQEKRKLFLAQAFTVCLTVVIGFPILFFAVNKSMELTIGNYKESQKNFEKLYRKTGKVQKQDIKKLNKYKY